MKRLKWVMLGLSCLLLACPIGAVAQSPAPVTGDSLVAIGTGGSSTEVDLATGQTLDIRYWFGWYKNDEPVHESSSGWIDAPYTVEGMSMPEIVVNRGEVWRVEMRVEDADGLYSAGTVEATVTIAGVPPTVGAVRIEVLEEPPPIP